MKQQFRITINLTYRHWLANHIIGDTAIMFLHLESPTSLKKLKMLKENDENDI